MNLKELNGTLELEQCWFGEVYDVAASRRNDARMVIRSQLMLVGYKAAMDCFDVQSALKSIVQ